MIRDTFFPFNRNSGPVFFMKPIKDNAVRESLWIVGAWCVCAVWILTASYWLPPTTPDSSTMIFGMPMWIVLGVFTPWFAATVFTIWFSLAMMTDDPEPETQDD